MTTKGCCPALALVLWAACNPQADQTPGPSGSDARPDGSEPDVAGGHGETHRPVDAAGGDPDAETDAAGETGSLASPEEIAIAGQLHQALLELPCMSEEIELQYCIPKDMGKRSVTLKFGGGFGERYAVVLGVWGVMETVTYKNGTEAGENFYIGGTAVTPMTAEYTLELGTQKYRLNHMVIGAGDHYTYPIAYQTPPITIPGGVSLVLSVRDPDNYVNTNHMDNVPADPPPALQVQLQRIDSGMPRWQYVYLEVKSVTRLVP